MAIAEIIKFEGPKEALVWKNSGKEYLISGDERQNALSQLIVDEFYEAILFANGNALDLFKPGRYTLTTQNIPLLTKAYENLVGGTPFPCKVYFINKVHQMELKWGTQGAITLNDPIYEIFLHVGTCGTMVVKIEDARRFLLKFVGNKDVFTNNDLLSNLRGIISSHVKNFISKIMIQGKVSFFDMNAHIYDVGLLVQKVLGMIFEQYGLSIEQFNIETIDVPQDDYDMINKAKSASTSRRIQGFTWKEEQMYQILESAAKNEGSSGTLMGAGMGLGMGVGLGAPMGRAFGDIAGSAFGSPQQPQTPGVSDEPITPIKSNGGENINVQDFFVKKEGQVQTDKRICGQCGNEVLPNALFCSHCGSKLGKKCKSCGHDLGADVRFCPNCGTKAE